MSKYLWLIRHSESEGNRERRIQGWTDFPLTTLGRRQSARLAERLAAEEGIHGIVASSLRRAAATAEILAAVVARPVRLDERLQEYGFGPLSGLTRGEIAERHPAVAAAWDRNEVWEPLPGEEGHPAFEARVRAALDAVVAATPDEAAAVVVAHGGCLNACLRAWLGIADFGWRTFAFDNASVTLVRLQASSRPGPDGAPGHNVRLLELNDVSHLKGLMSPKPAWFSAERPVPASGA